MHNDTNLIFEKYRQYSESLGLGPNAASTINIGVGHTTKHPPRRQPGGNTFNAFSSDEEVPESSCEDNEIPTVYIQAGDDDKDEYQDEEVDMARAELLKAADYATKLFNHLANVQELEGWTASKITKAADYLSSVYHHLDYKSISDSEL